VLASRVMSAAAKGRILPVRVLFLISLLLALFGGCAKQRSGPTRPVSGDTGCVACHSSRESLVATAEVDTSSAPPDAGET
jgi:hypothetical protein